MKTRAKIPAMVFAILALSTANISARTVTIQLTAEITWIDDYYDLLEGKINIGDIITGSYTYDSDTPDSNPSDSVGGYWYYTPPYGINLSACGFMFQTDPDNVNSSLGIHNGTYGADTYHIISYNNLPLSNGVEIDLIGWQLDDYSCTALSGDALPITPPVLEDWESNYLLITFGYKGASSIQGRVTSAIVEPAIIFVDGDANGLNNGSSWADAYNYLQDALDFTQYGDEIRVAKGIYMPTGYFTPPPPPQSADNNGKDSTETVDNRKVTFQLKNGVAIKGGYAGISEPDTDARDIDKYETILSGDIGIVGVFSDNCYQVVTGINIDTTAILDGFTITAGNANSYYPYRRGGGMYIEHGSPTVRNCIFRGNSALRNGGGMYNYESNPKITNCTFFGNSSIGDDGGAIYNNTSSPILINCTFRGNSANEGGGLYNYNSNPKLTNCTFTKNSAERAGGMYNRYGRTIVINCKFTENLAERGGGIYNNSNSIILTGCIFSGNEAGSYGGGLYNYQSDPTVANCTFANNLAYEKGGGIYISSGKPILINCILWGNTAPINLQISGNGKVLYSNVEGGWPGEGNIDADPCFVDPGYWDANGTPSDPNDDFWIEGNYHLLEDSPCINAGNPNYPYDPNETDLDDNPRIVGGRIDMGAYEYRPLIQADVRIVPRTISLASSGKWITAFLWLPEDYDVADIDPNSILLENEIEPERFWLSEDNQVAIAKFSRDEVQAILIVGEVELTITGQLMNKILFEGTDIIRVIDKGSENN